MNPVSIWEAGSCAPDIWCWSYFAACFKDIHHDQMVDMCLEHSMVPNPQQFVFADSWIKSVMIEKSQDSWWAAASWRSWHCYKWNTIINGKGFLFFM